VAATNRDLLARVKEGKFREDLYYRLNVVTIAVPPLRDRPSDIALLASHFLRKYAAENGKTIQGFSDEAFAQLAHYSWPGNVRELENAVERAVIICKTDMIRPEDLALSISATIPDGSMPQIPGSSMAAIERYVILKTLEQTGGSTSRAAEILGISTRTIQYRLHEYDEQTKGAPAPKEE
jgi:two-component system response regulator HydG